MRVLIFLLLMTGLFASCGSSTVPADIIPGKKMETIVWQLMQSDEHINNVLAKDSTKKNNTERMKIYQQVFDLNKTSMSEFKRSYQFYMAHPDITKIMFDSIAVKTGRQRTELYKPKSDTSAAKANRQRTELNKSKPDTAAAKLIMQHIKIYKPKAGTTSPGKKAAVQHIKLNKPRHDTTIKQLKKR